MTKIAFLRIILFTVLASSTLASASTINDQITWWYNGVGTAGPFALSSELAGWRATPFRPGTIVFQRDLLAGTVSNYVNSTLFESSGVAYDSGTEDSLRILYGSSFSAGNITYVSTYIRYRLNEMWSEWINMNFFICHS